MANDTSDTIKRELATTRKLVIDLNQIRNDGIFLQVHVGGASLMTRQTTLAERGLINSDIRRELQTAGVTLTVPRAIYAKFHSIENKTRSACDRLSVDIAGFRPWRFMTWAMAAKWYEMHKRYCDETDALVEQYKNELPGWRNEVRTKFMGAGMAAWNSLISNTNKRGDRTFEMYGREWNIRSKNDAADFVERVVELAMEQIPSEISFRSSVRVDFEIALAQLGSEIQKELAEFEVNAIARSDARLKALEAARAVAGAEREARLREASARFEEEMVKRAVAERIRQQLADVTSPYDDVINALRGKMAASARKVLAGIEKSGRVTKIVAKNIDAMLDLYQTMRLGDDKELDQLMKKVWANMSAREANGTDTADTLGQLLTQLSGIPMRAAKIAEKEADIAALTSQLEDGGENTGTAKRESGTVAPRAGRGDREGDGAEPVAKPVKRQPKRSVDISVLEIGD